MSNKTIKINPELFSIGGKRKKGDKQKTKTHANKIKNSAIKNELIKKIKQHRKNEIDQRTKSTSVPESQTEFQDSMNYLQHLHNKRMHKKTLKKKLQNPAVSVELPNELSPFEHTIYKPDSAIQTTIQEMSTELNKELSETNDIIQNNEMPAYGCLKNSSLPTYREWKKKTQKNPDEPTIVIEGPPLETIGTNKNQLENIKNIYNSSDKKITKKKTKRYKLGKNNRMVSILIQNNVTRKKIQDEVSELKKTKLMDVKNHLKKNGLIKAGCIAPNNVLRNIYENSVLCGKVNNTSGENLVHNFMAEAPAGMV